MSVTGGIGRRWYGCLRNWTRNAYREDKNQNIFQSRAIACLYKRTSKERRKGNPPTPSTLSLYTIRLPPLEPFSMLQYTIRILSHDLTHHSVIPYHNNHAISSDIATPLTASLSLLNCTATISPLSPRLPTSPPFRNTIPSAPPVSFFYHSQVSPYLPVPWQWVYPQGNTLWIRQYTAVDNRKCKPETSMGSLSTRRA